MHSSECKLSLCGMGAGGGGRLDKTGLEDANMNFCVCYCFNKSVYAGNTLSQHKDVNTALTHTFMDHALQGAVVTSPRLLLYMH